jgi:hypothetical protein
MTGEVQPNGLRVTCIYTASVTSRAGYSQEGRMVVGEVGVLARNLTPVRNAARDQAS